MQVAERIGVDPVTVITERDWRKRAIRTAAAFALWDEDEKRAKQEKQANK